MNEVTFIEKIDNGIKRTTIDDISLYKDILKFCFNTFDQNNSQVRTFAFILNDDKSNFFTELLTNEKFISDINQIINNKLTMLWCQPNVQVENNTDKPFEYFTTVKNANSYEIWQGLAKYSKNPSTIPVFPTLLLLKVEKNTDIYRIIEVKSLNFTMDSFANVLEFRDYFLDLINQIIDFVALDSEGKSTSGNNDFANYFKKGASFGAGKKALDYALDQFEGLKEIDLKEFIEDLFNNGLS